MFFFAFNKLVIWLVGLFYADLRKLFPKHIDSVKVNISSKQKGKFLTDLIEIIVKFDDFFVNINIDTCDVV